MDQSATYGKYNGKFVIIVAPGPVKTVIRYPRTPMDMLITAPTEELEDLAEPAEPGAGIGEYNANKKSFYVARAIRGVR